MFTDKHVAVRVLARDFARLLRSTIGDAAVAQVIEANRHLPPEACASHDFCDSNVVMADAFRTIYSRDPHPNSERDTDLINAAWTLAKRHGFWVEAGPYYAAYHTEIALRIDGIGTTPDEAWQMVVDGAGPFSTSEGIPVSAADARKHWTIRKCTEALYHDVESYGGGIAWGELPDGTLCTVGEEDEARGDE